MSVFRCREVRFLRKSVRIFSRFRFDSASGFPFERVGTGCLLVTGGGPAGPWLVQYAASRPAYPDGSVRFRSSFLRRLVRRCQLPVRD